MNIYLISQSVNNGYDTFDSAVVAAEDAERARFTHPASSWRGISIPRSRKEWDDTVWCDPSLVEVRLLGKAIEGTPPGVICSSFNAG